MAGNCAEEEDETDLDHQEATAQIAGIVLNAPIALSAGTVETAVSVPIAVLAEVVVGPGDQVVRVVALTAGADGVPTEKINRPPRSMIGMTFHRWPPPNGVRNLLEYSLVRL